MIRPIIYYSVTRIAVALVLSLLWNRYLNSYGPEALYSRAFLMAAVCFGAISWFIYLRMDGVKIHYLLEDRHQRKKRKHSHADIADFVDEKIISFDELEDDEKDVCRLLGNIFCFLLFLILSFLG